MAQRIKVIDIREFPSTDPKRVGKFDVVVTYQLDAFRTYIVTIPKEEFTEAKLKEVIRKELEEKERWIGREIEL